jgi:hypothetical protein
MSLTKVRKAKKLLNRYAPKGEQLAFINSKEAKLLKKLGGAGVNIKGTGIKSYFDDSGDDYGGYDSGSSSSSSNDNNSDNDSGSSYDYIPQQFTPAPTPTPTQTFADDDYTLTPEETKEQQDTISSSIDDLKNTIEDDGTSLYTTTPDYTYDEKKGIYNAPTFQGPYVDSRDDPFTTAKNTDTGIFSKIGSGLKTAAKIALPFVAAPIAGALGLAKPYQAYSTFNRGKKGLDYISKLSKGRVPTSADLLKTALTKGPSVKGPTGFNDNDSNEGNALVAKNVIAKNVQKYSPEYKNRAIDLRDRLQPVKDRLNEKGQMTLASLNKLIETFQV